MVAKSVSISVPLKEHCLPGRDASMFVADKNIVTGESMTPPFSDSFEKIYFAMGCFWGAERRFWEQQGVITTAVGYAGGSTPNPTYEETCTGLTGHTEVVMVIYDPSMTTLYALLAVFWESHDPTQGMRQGNDVGTQYRSAIFCDSQEQLDSVCRSAFDVQEQLASLGYGEITSQIDLAPQFYYAEDYHQQYLVKNPMGYCGLKGTGISCR